MRALLSLLIIAFFVYVMVTLAMRNCEPPMTWAELIDLVRWKLGK